MKKLILTFCLAVAATGLFAQGLSGGLKAGLNIANQKFSADGLSISPDALTSFHFGGYVNIGVSEKLSVQPELLYNMVGSKFEDIKNNYNYLSVPIMVKYNVAPVFSLQAGPQIGMLLSAESDGEDIKDFTKGIDFGLGLGAGVDLPMGLNFTARYVLGLSNISDDADFGDATLKNNVFQISVGYRLFGGE